LGLGRILGPRSSVAVPIRRNASAELLGDIRLSGNGHRSLWHPLSGGRQSSRAELAPGCGRPFGQDARPDWIADSCFARSLASCDRGLVPHERSDLVGSFRALLIRCLVGISIYTWRSVELIGETKL